MIANPDDGVIAGAIPGAVRTERGVAALLVQSVLTLVFLTSMGCSSSDQEGGNGAPETLTAEEIARLPRVKGIPLGHLKPANSTRKQNASQSLPEFARRPHVRWVLDGEQLTELDPPEPLDNFRLDFDETRRLTFNDLPYAFMTEKSREVVIRRGDVLLGSFQDPRISADENCVLVFTCKNVDCPRRREVLTASRFPFDPSSGEPPVCPFCGSKDDQGNSTLSSRYKTSQARGLEQEIQRQFYRNRAKRDADR